MRKSIIATLLLVAMLLNIGLAAVVAEEAKPEKLIYVTLGDTATEVLEKAAASFFEETGIKVEIQNYPFADAHTKLVTLITSGKQPDISYGFADWVGEFTERDAIVNIDEYASPEFIDDIYDNAWALCTVDGKRMGVPYFMSDWALYVNKGILDEKGIAIPTTMDELVAAVEAVHNPPEYYGFGLLTSAHKNQFDFFFSVFLAMGGELLAEDRKSVAFNNENGVKALETYKKLSEYAQPGAGAGDIYEVTNAFKAEKIVFCPNNPRLIKELVAEGQDFDYEIVPMPMGENGDKILGVMDVHYIYKTPNSKYAMQFLEHYYKVENVLPAWKQYNFIPNSKSLAADEFYKTNENLKPFIESASRAEFRPTIPEWPQIELLVRDAIAQVCIDGADAKTVLDAAAEEANALLAGD